MNENTRNIAIVVAIAAALTVSRTAGVAASAVYSILNILFLVGLAYFGYTVYRSQRHRLALLSTRERTILYGAVALLALLLLSGTFLVRSWSPFTSIVYLALVGGCAFVIWKVWTESNRYY